MEQILLPAQFTFMANNSKNFGKTHDYKSFANKIRTMLKNAEEGFE